MFIRPLIDYALHDKFRIQDWQYWGSKKLLVSKKIYIFTNSTNESLQNFYLPTQLDSLLSSSVCTLAEVKIPLETEIIKKKISIT